MHRLGRRLFFSLPRQNLYGTLRFKVSTFRPLCRDSEHSELAITTICVDGGVGSCDEQLVSSTRCTRRLNINGSRLESAVDFVVRGGQAGQVELPRIAAMPFMSQNYFSYTVSMSKPTDCPRVSHMFAKFFLRADFASAILMWQQLHLCRARCIEGNTDKRCNSDACTSDISAAAVIDGTVAHHAVTCRHCVDEGRGPGNSNPVSSSIVPVPHFYWIKGDQEEEGACRRYCVLLSPADEGDLMQPQVRASPFWMPTRLLHHLPFFPIHQRCAESSLLISQSNPPYKWSDSVPSTALIGLSMNDTKVASTVNCVKDVTSFWSTLVDPTDTLTAPHYLPPEAHPYLHRVSIFGLFYQRRNISYTAKVLQRSALRCGPSLTMLRREGHTRDGVNAKLVKYGVEDANGLARPRRGYERRPYKSSFHVQSTISCFGEKFVNTANTALNCLLDSTTCVQHAVPLDEHGNVFFAGIETLRRQFYNENQRLHTQRIHPAVNTAAVQFSREPHATPPRWTRLWSPSSSLSPTARALAWRRARRRSHFTFQSPYWVKVSTASERWGVEVSKLAHPVCVGAQPYVNAEETSDASRFNSHTCTPQRIHKVLCETELFVCSWNASARLRRLCLSAAAQNGRRTAPYAVSSSTPVTYATLMSEAAELYQCCNLWITESLMRRLGWTLTSPSATHITAQISETDRDTTNIAPQCDGVVTAPTMGIVNAACIVEQMELLFLLSYRPIIYFDRVEDLQEDDDGFDIWRRLAARREEGLRTRTVPIPSEATISQLHAKALHQKRRQANLWQGCTLPLSFRLQMGILALQKKYALEDRSVWFTNDFVRHTLFMTQRHSSVTALRIVLHQWHNTCDPRLYTTTHADDGEDDITGEWRRYGSATCHVLPLIVINKGEIVRSDGLDAQLAAPVNITQTF